MPARVKLKRVGGAPYITWNMRFNSILRGELTRAGARLRRALDRQADRAGGCAWPPQAHGVISEFGLGIGETRPDERPPQRTPTGEGAGQGGRGKDGARKREAGGAKVGPYALDVLGDPRVTMRPAEAGGEIPERSRRAVGIVRWEGARERGTFRKRASS